MKKVSNKEFEKIFFDVLLNKDKMKMSLKIKRHNAVLNCLFYDPKCVWIFCNPNTSRLLKFKDNSKCKTFFQLQVLEKIKSKSLKIKLFIWTGYDNEPVQDKKNHLARYLLRASSDNVEVFYIHPHGEKIKEIAGMFRSEQPENFLFTDECNYMIEVCPNKDGVSYSLGLNQKEDIKNMAQVLDPNGYELFFNKMKEEAELNVWAKIRKKFGS